MSHQEPSCAQHRKAESAPKGSVETVGEEGAIGKKEDIAGESDAREAVKSEGGVDEGIVATEAPMGAVDGVENGNQLEQ